MDINKLEEEMREKLEERRIEPSSVAWEKLEARLDAEMPVEKNKAWTYAIAAVAVIALMATAFFWQPVDVSTEVVHEAAPKEELLQKPVEEEKVPLIEKVFDSEVQSAIAEHSEKEIPSKSSKAPSNFQEEETENFKAVQEDILLKEVEDVVLAIQEIEITDPDKLAVEVEALLAAAQKNIQKKSDLKSSEISAAELLFEAELELEKSFYDKVYDAVNENFKRIIVAYSERNK